MVVETLIVDPKRFVEVDFVAPSLRFIATDLSYSLNVRLCRDRFHRMQVSGRALP